MKKLQDLVIEAIDNFPDISRSWVHRDGQETIVLVHSRNGDDPLVLFYRDFGRQPLYSSTGQLCYADTGGNAVYLASSMGAYNELKERSKTLFSKEQ